MHLPDCRLFTALCCIGYAELRPNNHREGAPTLIYHPLIEMILKILSRSFWHTWKILKILFQKIWVFKGKKLENNHSQVVSNLVGIFLTWEWMAFRQSENISKFLSVFLLFVWAILSLAYILRLQAPISIINSFILLWSTVIVLYFRSHQNNVNLL